MTGPNRNVEKVIVAVGSTRRPKLDAVREGLEALAPRFHDAVEFEVASIEVPSGVRDTPLSRDETMAGARRRAEALVDIAHEQRKPWKYFVGLEGGLDIVHQQGVRWVFLQNWTYVRDSAGHAAFGQSGALLLPDLLVKRVVDEGMELAQAIDAFAEGQGIRDAQGAWGVLTRDIITRRDAVRISVINAFAALFASSNPSP